VHLCEGIDTEAKFAGLLEVYQSETDERGRRIMMGPIRVLMLFLLTQHLLMFAHATETVSFWASSPFFCH